MPKLVFVLCLLFAQTSVWGQKVQISGRVTDSHTGEGLPAANIIYERAKGTVSDENGVYHLAVSPGRIFLRFQYMGYKSKVREMVLSADDTLEINVELEPDVTQIDQVIVSAGRVEQRVAESTVSMTVIRPQEFSAAHVSDPRELINKTPGIEVIDGQASVRGGSGYSYGAGSRVLTLIDGLPVLAADAGSIRWQFLPMENISQIEIIKGASSVLYGSSALNGVINFRSARATREGRTSAYTETGIFDNPSNQDWKWWSANNPRMFTTLSFSHLKKYKATELGIGAFGAADKGYRRLNHENVGRVNLSLRRESPKIKGLTAGLKTLVGFSDKRDFLLWEDAEQGALRQDATTATLLRATFLAIDPYVSFASPDQYSHDLRMRIQMTDNNFPDNPEIASNALSILTEYQGWFNLNEMINLNAGIFQNASFITSSFYGDHTSLNLAAFAQADFSLGQRLKMVGGLRLEHNSLNGQYKNPVPLFRSGINFMATNYTFIRASFGQGYRYPSIAEKHAATTLGAVRIFPNALLKPESGWNAELGVKQGIMVQGWDGMIDLALFYSRNKDLIEFLFGIYPDPVSGTSQPGFRADNTEYSRVYGAETEFLFQHKTGIFDHTFSGGYLYIYPVEFNPSTGNNTGVFLKYRRQHSAKLSLHTRYKNIEPGISLYYKSKILAIDDVFLNPATREGILPGFHQYWQDHNQGYYTLDANLGYHFNNRYKLSFAVKNLTNSEYMTRPGDIRPHRNFSLRLSVLF